MSNDTIDTATGLGYVPDFLETPIGLPQPPAGAESVALDYQHFTVVMNPVRRLAWSVSWNVDGTRFFPDIPREDDFYPDDRLPIDQQTTNEVYTANDLDRGHIARRADLLWGTYAQAQQANRDSFCFTNIAPQHSNFNQSGRGGVWGELENGVLELEQLTDRRISVSGGPVFADDDPEYRGITLPREFWKIVVYRLDGILRARAFLLTQNIDDVVSVYLDEFETYEVAIEDLSARTGLTFSGLPETTPAIIARGPQLIQSLADVQW